MIWRGEECCVRADPVGRPAGHSVLGEGLPPPLLERGREAADCMVEVRGPSQQEERGRENLTPTGLAANCAGLAAN